MTELEDLKDTVGYVISRLWENALLAKKDRDEAKTEEEKQFHEGRLEAYWEVFDTLSSEVEVQDVKPDEISFHYDLTELT